MIEPEVSFDALGPTLELRILPQRYFRTFIGPGEWDNFGRFWSGGH
uniref:AraC family transcriptional regulator n=1 Tax=Heterorhabditis bacteriophora TaxID=37862 RepID=A0A1I7W7G1_HETBA